MQRRLFTLIVVALLAISLTACGSSKKSKSPTGATITIQNFAFSLTTAKAGSTVTVQNKDSTTHTVTSDKSGLFDAGNVEPGKTKTFTAPSTPGNYTYHCNIHSQMHATLIVN
jgi:plastocyanin